MKIEAVDGFGDFVCIFVSLALLLKSFNWIDHGVCVIHKKHTQL